MRARWMIGLAVAVLSASCVDYTGLDSDSIDYTKVGNIGGSGLCGNAIINRTEECDDGNSNDADGCSNACTKGGTGPCVSCSEYYSNGGMGELCPASQTLAESLDSCVCGTCEADCGAMCDSTAMACEDCLKAAALDTCKAEFTTCSNDT